MPNACSYLSSYGVGSKANKLSSGVAFSRSPFPGADNDSDPTSQHLSANTLRIMDAKNPPGQMARRARRINYPGDDSNITGDVLIITSDVLNYPEPDWF